MQERRAYGLGQLLGARRAVLPVFWYERVSFAKREACCCRRYSSCFGWLQFARGSRNQLHPPSRKTI